MKLHIGYRAVGRARMLVPALFFFIALQMACSSSLFAENLPTAESTSIDTQIKGLTEQNAELGYVVNNILLFGCAILVLFMQAGFALVESGLNCAKNVVNILFKNLMDLGVGVLLFFLIGFAIMYPGNYTETPNGFLNLPGFGIYTAKAGAKFSPYVDWFFQAVFAATAATIVSGAVAGRMKFKAYLIYSAILTGLIYPISGFWKWGGGWLTQFGTLGDDGAWSMAFQDFAGSAIVHAVGGFAGLAGAMILGARLGRFDGKKPKPIPGHNLAFAALGVFILWVGWYGFNPGSQLGFNTRADVDAISLIAVNTTLAAAAGMVLITFWSWFWLGKPDLSLSLNGALGGLVGITACCDCLTTWWAIVVGLVSGILVLAGIFLLERLKIDDPVGAFPVHGLCGVWGCLAIGILPNTHLASGATSLWIQLLGVGVICSWAFLAMLGVFLLLRKFDWLRVSEAEERAGLDISEHGMHAYAHDIPQPAFGLPGAAPGQLSKPSSVPKTESKPATKKETKPTTTGKKSKVKSDPKTEPIPSPSSA